jgi:hypothetical protein
MDTEDAVGDNSSNRKEVECIRYDFPSFDCHSSLTLVVKSIEFVQLARLVVAPEQEEVVGMLDLVGH